MRTIHVVSSANMAAENEGLDAVKEWLTSEVKLKQYFDKLVLHGFTTLEACSIIDENALNRLEIIPPYHRKRLMKFSVNLREKLRNRSDEEDNTNHDLARGNGKQNELISFGDENEKTSSPPSIPTTAVRRDEAPVLPPKKIRPPPIPRRLDLDAEDAKTQSIPVPSREAPPSDPGPRRAAPVKPPRTSRKLSQENVLLSHSRTDLGGKIAGHCSNGRDGDIGSAVVGESVLASSTESQIATCVNDIGTEQHRQQTLNEPIRKASEEEPECRSPTGNNVQGKESQSEMSTIQPTRPVPTPPVRLSSSMSSSSFKKPVPAPRSRFKSEQGLDLSNLQSHSNSNEVTPAIPPKRPMSFSKGQVRQPAIPNEKPSTLPRYPQYEKPPPPLPPTRQTPVTPLVRQPVENSAPRSSLMAPPATVSVSPTDETSNAPVSQVPGQTQNPLGTPDSQEYEEISPRQRSQPVTYDLLNPAVQDPRNSVANAAIYESVGSKPNNGGQETAEVEYESDDCLSEGADDLWMYDSVKMRSDSIDSTGGSDNSRGSGAFLYPNVRQSDGYLWKQGGQQGNKGWRKRWFVFNGKDLRYFKDKDSLNESLHIIPVTQIRDIENVKDAKRSCFKVITPNRTFLLAAQNITEMILWSQTLMEACRGNREIHEDDSAVDILGDLLSKMSFAKDSNVSDEASSTTDSITASSSNNDINKVVSVDTTATLSDEGSSSNESTNVADNRLRLKKLNEFTDACGGAEPIGQAKKRWEDLTSRSKKHRVDQATNVIVSALDGFAPGDAGGIWDAIQSSQSVQKSLGISQSADRKYLEALAETYLNATTWNTRRQVLGIIADLVPFSEIQKFIPGVTEYRFKLARLHILKYGRGASVPVQRSPRMRVNESQLDHFLSFITSAHVIQDLPFGQRYLHLANGQVLECPNVIRSMIPQRIMAQYIQFCKESEIKPFSNSTMSRILSVCSATVRKSLQGLDYISSDGGKAFDDLAGILTRLAPYGCEREWISSCEAALKAGKQYIKTDYKTDSISGKRGGDMNEPDKEGWLKKQGHNVVADWKKRYVAIKEDKICYYDTYEDFYYATPINCINAALAKVKISDGHRNRFLIITPNKSYSFQAETESEAASWMVAIETAIQIGLGDRMILEKVYENPSNRYCADCGMKDPVWASVNFCVCVCAHCIGVHRNLGVHCSKPRSLLMDEKVWNPTLLELMVKIGNANANQLLEHKLPDDDKILPDTESSLRREFIYSKYWEKKYCKFHRSFGNPNELGEVLQKTVVTEDVMTTLELIINKVDVHYISSDSEDEKPPIELAREAGQTLQAELLRQNGAESGKLDRQISFEDLCGTVNNEVAPVSPAEVVYEKEGFLYKKEGSWRKRWFLLKERELKYTRGPHEKEELGMINLRTVTSLVKVPKMEPLQLDVVTVDKTHSLKADTDEELEAWYSALKSKQVFGVLLSQQELGSDGIPHLVAKCLQFVESYGGIEMEGVYRVNGSQLMMKKLETSFDQDAARVLLTLDECGVHDVTGVLKKYLRHLPDPVIPGDMYDAFIQASLNPDHSIRLQTIKELIASLPKVNHDTLKKIVFHLTKVVSCVAVNKMGIPNVAMIFGPTLMSNEQTGGMDDSSINKEFLLTGEMITYFQWLFDVNEEEVRKDQIMKDALEKIRRLQTESTQPQPSSEEFTLDIYVNEANEQPCRLKVSGDMTAHMVCSQIVSQRALAPDVNWALFEVVGNGAMERAFQVREKVLAAAKWGSGNYLILKENYIAENIAPYVGSTLSIEGPLHTRDPKNKNWKQSSVCLKNGYMLVDKGKSFFKAIKSDKSETDQWPLHKMTLYVGIPAEKSTKGLDPSCGFTVVVKTDQEDITRYMCAKDKGDMHRWVAAVLNMKHPEGIWSDPSQADTVGTLSAESKGKQTEDLPFFLGRQSFNLRRKGSSKHVVEELRLKQKSLRRPVDRAPPPT